MLLDFLMSIALAVPISASKSASDRDCGPRSNAGFIPAEQGLRDLGMPTEILSAMASVTINKARCSGSFVSDTGDILLASHCLEGCAKEREKSWKGTTRPSLSCKAKINGQETRVEVLTMSRCNALLDMAVALADKSGKKIPPELSECGKAGDLALIRPAKFTQNFNCLSMTYGKPSLGDPMFTVGRPSATSRPGGENSDGTSLYLSSGSMVRQNHCLDQGYDPGFWSRLWGEKSEDPSSKELGPQADFLSTRMIQSTVDIVPGSSGGPLINSRGEIIGVASNLDTATSNARECKGAQFFESTDKLRDTAKNWNPSFDPSKLRCNERHALGHGV